MTIMQLFQYLLLTASAVNAHCQFLLQESCHSTLTLSVVQTHSRAWLSVERTLAIGLMSVRRTTGRTSKSADGVHICSHADVLQWPSHRCQVQGHTLRPDVGLVSSDLQRDCRFSYWLQGEPEPLSSWTSGLLHGKSTSWADSYHLGWLW